MPTKFKKIYVELSDICGLECSFCPTKKGVRGVMSVDNFAKLLPQIHNKAELFSFHVLGDPLILPNLSEYLELANAYKMPIDLTTSGFYMSDKNVEILLKFNNIHQINFSLIASFSQQKLSFNEYIKPILSFCKRHLKEQNDSFINLRLWNLNKDFKNTKNTQIYELLQDFFKCEIRPNLSKNRLARRIFLHQARLFKWANEGLKAENQGFCHALSKQIAILSDGTLVPCCIDASGVINLGNAFERPFDELLQGQRLLAMKNGFKNKLRVETLCQKCEFFKRDL